MHGHQEAIINLYLAHIARTVNGILSEMINKTRIFILFVYASFITTLKYTKERSLKVDLILDKIDKIKGS